MLLRMRPWKLCHGGNNHYIYSLDFGFLHDVQSEFTDFSELHVGPIFTGQVNENNQMGRVRPYI
jgi:hypothetical protein